MLKYFHAITVDVIDVSNCLLPSQKNIVLEMPQACQVVARAAAQFCLCTSITFRGKEYTRYNPFVAALSKWMNGQAAAHVAAPEQDGVPLSQEAGPVDLQGLRAFLSDNKVSVACKFQNAYRAAHGKVLDSIAISHRHSTPSLQQVVNAVASAVDSEIRSDWLRIAVDTTKKLEDKGSEDDTVFSVAFFGDTAVLEDHPIDDHW